MTDGQHISQEDLALNAMQALSPEESAAVRAHLVTCSQCQSDLKELSGDLALLALGVEQHPVPEGARQRFMQKIASDSEHVSQPARAQVIPINQRPARKIAIWIPWIAVAAVAIFAVSLEMKVTRLNERLRDQSHQNAELAATSAHAQQVLDVLTAPSAQNILLTAVKTPAAPTARAVYLASSGGLILQANNLASLAEDKTYELWVIPANGASPIPAGLFRPDASGNASLIVPPLPKGVAAKAFGVTIEKAGGANTPTAPIILSGAAPSTGE